MSSPAGAVQLCIFERLARPFDMVHCASMTAWLTISALMVAPVAAAELVHFDEQGAVYTPLELPLVA